MLSVKLCHFFNLLSLYVLYLVVVCMHVPVVTTFHAKVSLQLHRLKEFGHYIFTSKYPKYTTLSHTLLHSMFPLHCQKLTQSLYILREFKFMQ